MAIFSDSSFTLEGTVMRRSLTTLLIVVVVFGSHSVFAQEADKMEFSTNSGGPTLTKETDSVDISLEGNVLTIVGHIPTGDPARPYQTMRLRLRNYDGSRELPASYQLGSGDAIWQNFAGTTGLCNCQYGLFTINTVEGSGRMTGTFEFRCNTLFPSGNEVSTHVFNGHVSGIIPISLKIKVRPGEKFSVKPDDDVTLSVTVENAVTGTLVKDATLLVVDNPITKDKNLNVATSDANGQAKYTFKVPKELTERKTYDVVLSAQKIKAIQAPNVTQKIEVEPDRRYFYYRCGGVPIIQYDAGEGETWEVEKEGSPIIKASGSKVVINNMLTYHGSNFRIDTTPGSERAFYDGDLFCDGCSESFILSSVAFVMTTVGLDCEGVIKLASSVQPGIEFLGGKVKLTEFGFIGSWNDPGIKMTITGEMPTDYGISAKCLKSNNPDNQSVGVGFVYKKSTGFEQIKLDIENISIGKAFCMNDLEVTYDYTKKLLDAYCRITWEMLDGPNKPKGNEAKIKTVLRGEQQGDKTHIFLKDFSLQVTSDFCKTIPIRPEFCFKGARIDAGFDTEKGQKKWKFGLTGIFKPSLENSLKFLQSWNSKLGSTQPEAAEFELGGLWEYPASFTGKAQLKLAKIPYISETKSWQGILSGSINIDFTKGLYGKVSGNIGHLGMDDFFASVTDVKLNLGMVPFDVSLSGTASLRIPQVGTELNETGAAKYLRWIESFGLSNITLGQGQMYLGINEVDGFKFLAVADVTKNPIPIVRSYGRMFLQISVPPVDGYYLNWGSGYDKLAVMREKTDPKSIVSKGGAFVQAAPADTFTVTADMERVFILVSGETTAPQSELVSPTGETYATTKPDSSIIRFDASNGAMTQWVLIEPAQGNWVIKLTNPKPEDEVAISSLRRERAFALTASVTNRVLTVTWNPEGLDTSDRVSLVLTETLGEMGGVQIGTVRASHGTYSYTLTDSLLACSYYVGGVLAATGSTIATAFAPDPIQTGKVILAPPTNIQALKNTTNNVTTITWQPSPDPMAASYAILDRTAEGDTVLAFAERYETSKSFGPDITFTNIKMVTIGDNDLRGCPSESVDVVTSVIEDVWAGQSKEMRLVPNPATDVVMLHARNLREGPVSIQIVNMMGQRVARYTAYSSSIGEAEQAMDISGLASGMYYVHIVQASETFTEPLSIQR